MAFLIKSALGEPSGKLGILVFRRVNGKVVIATAPDHFKPSNSPKAKSARDKFGAGVQFAAFINSLKRIRCCHG